MCKQRLDGAEIVLETRSSMQRVTNRDTDPGAPAYRARFNAKTSS